MRVSITKVKMADGRMFWKARDVGRHLGFGSKGGNLSRMFTQEMFPKETAPQKGKHWVEKRADPVTNRGAVCVWLTTEGLRYVLQFFYFESTPYSKKAHELYQHFVKKKIFKATAKSTELIYEETLGAGLEVRFTDQGMLAFVFMDEDDKTHTLATRDLDEGWEEKLLKAIGPWPR